MVLAWLLPDETNEAADRLADRLEQEFAVVPAIWALENDKGCHSPRWMGSFARHVWPLNLWSRRSPVQALERVGMHLSKRSEPDLMDLLDLGIFDGPLSGRR